MSRPGESYEPLLSSWSVGSIVSELCERVGVPFDAIDATLLEGMVDGFYVSGGSSSATGAIEQLAGVYQFDTANYDGALHFIPRGGSSVAVIDDDDIIDDGKDVETRTRADPINVPRIMNLRYFDTDGGLTPNKQTSDRSSDYRARAEVSKETTVIMRADDAARAITIQHKVEIEDQRGEIEFSLPMNWIWLTVSDVIIFRGNRLRISTVDLDDGMQRYKASFDRVSAYQSTIQGLPIPIPSEPPNLEPSDTVLHIIDSHILRDSQDDLGYFVAVSGEGLEWKGAIVQLSMDGGATWESGGAITTTAVMGELVTVMPAGSVAYPDDVNTVDVELLRADMDLTPATLAEMMNRANLCIIGDELINFSGAEQLTDTRWRLSYFLRGRKGTASVSHAIGERFVIMTPSMVTFVRSELFYLGRDMTFRATSIGKAATLETQTITFTGRSQIERVPAYLSYELFMDGMVEKMRISWQGVGRLGASTSVGMGRYFTGFRVTGDAVTGGTVDTTDSSIVLDYMPGMISVQQVNQITGAGVAAEIEVL
jgi:hypothetical protein